MEIRNNYNTYNPNFGILLKRESVLEAASGHLFGDHGIEGFRDVFVAFGDKKFPGKVGFRGYAINIGEKINSKYPAIKKASSEIKEIINNNPQISQKELNNKIHEIVDRFEPTIDIIL